MNKLTKEEFIDRTKAFMRARKIFINSGVTKNISIAFELYQQVLADRERDWQIVTAKAGNRPRTIMDGYERPLCPKCGEEMRLRPVPDNDENVKTQLFCSNAKCDTVLDSDKDIQWWFDNLQKKETENVEVIIKENTEMMENVEMTENS